MTTTTDWQTKLAEMLGPPQARTFDPATSHEAAASLDSLRLTATREAILRLLRANPDGLSDTSIAELYHGPEASPSGLRTRRCELVAAGLVVDTGRRDVTPSGRSTIVWSAT